MSSMANGPASPHRVHTTGWSTYRALVRMRYLTASKNGRSYRERCFVAVVEDAVGRVKDLECHRLGQVLQKRAMRSSLGAWRFEIFSGMSWQTKNSMLFSFLRRVRQTGIWLRILNGRTTARIIGQSCRVTLSTTLGSQL